MCNRLSKVKSSIDNKLVQPLKPQTMKLKEQLARRGVMQKQAERNEHLLGRIYKIFTRDRPSQKGFNERGQPMKQA